MSEQANIWDEVKHETEGGRYGSYRFRDDSGREGVYFWAQRVEDYGHRVFGTLEEAAAFVNTR